MTQNLDIWWQTKSYYIKHGSACSNRFWWSTIEQVHCTWHKAEKDKKLVPSAPRNTATDTTADTFSDPLAHSRFYWNNLKQANQHPPYKTMMIKLMLFLFSLTSQLIWEERHRGWFWGRSRNCLEPSGLGFWNQSAYRVEQRMCVGKGSPDTSQCYSKFEKEVHKGCKGFGRWCLDVVQHGGSTGFTGAGTISPHVESYNGAIDRQWWQKSLVQQWQKSLVRLPQAGSVVSWWQFGVLCVEYCCCGRLNNIASNFK